ncbi:MAG: cysteine desulfurase [Clostridiales bacterium]|jgi:cysteine desulfurase|nr:cysteine desulfurase [Clostridiales bacterium]
MIYLDNAATTAVFDECNDIIREYNSLKYFNPSALYGHASGAARDLKTARENILRHLGGLNNGNLIFTASGTEANNIALLCKSFKKYSRIIISAAEHDAVYNTAAYLKQKDFEVIICPVDGFGRVNPEELANYADENTALVSVIHVCNETGAVNDIETSVKKVKEKSPKCLFHSDGVQAFKKIDVNVSKLGVDLYTISGHKIHAPKGVGALYFKNGVNLNTFIHGGGQEYNIRSATENLSSIAAFSKAADIMSRKKINRQLLVGLKDFLATEFDAIINTPDGDINNILSVAFKGIKGEVLLHALEKHDIIVGTGSACSSKKSGKRIAEALKLPENYVQGILRISINENTNYNEILELQEKLKLEYENLSKYKS